MRSVRPRLGRPVAAALLALTTGGVLLAYAVAPARPRPRALLSDATMLVALAVAGWVLLQAVRDGRAWPPARWFGLGLLGLAGASGAFLAYDLAVGPSYRSGLLDLAFLPLALPFLLPARAEFRAHFTPEDRREIVADVALLTAALAAIASLFLRPAGADVATSISSGVFAVIGVAGITTFAALAVWVPTVRHLGHLAAVSTMALGVLRFGGQWVRGAYPGGDPATELPLTLGGLGLALLLAVLPKGESRLPPRVRATWARPLLTTGAVIAASTALALVAVRQLDGRFGAEGGRMLIAFLAAAVAVRILVNQIRSVEATDQARRALEQKEAALAESERAMQELSEAHDSARRSEEHLRSVFDAAVDGIVELDERDLIVRTNEAFCRMVRMPREVVEGQPWTAVAAAADGADPSFASLPETGQGTLRRDGQPVYLESRISRIPTDQPRRLLLVRDVTTARVADQTIRALFKFLQDRDEDRTRIMRRTNAAIEAERNRIARDLHDGPVQGVSAASLSLEAALLMIRAGETQEGMELLSKVRQELAEEADNLRRLMSGLRPPLLEERGLVPALREMLSRFGTDQGIETEFSGTTSGEIPEDLETLAYRVVQEALSNIGKHAGATKVTVSVEVDGGQLRVEVADDGKGFDAAKSRDFLRMGRVGLASMRERVELANGTFMVHSTPGKGTTVLATLPVGDSPQLRRELARHEA
ncbi:MAG TPA: PAS domain-containing sensor histidine kinase [Actinomycetota bacterium]|nr:PAS domain-containing sensor histidine kinase [Actinomycetota bacterium]